MDIDRNGQHMKPWPGWADERFQPANLFDGPEVETLPDLFTALQDQLGLKLDVKKGLIEVLVVDHAEKATEN
jgi:uncharacterized protein (TIGR03435 family)